MVCNFRCFSFPITEDSLCAQVHIQSPVTAVQSKSGTYASPHLHGETELFLAGGMVHGFQQKGVVFEGRSPWILKKGE